MRALGRNLTSLQVQSRRRNDYEQAYGIGGVSVVGGGALATGGRGYRVDELRQVDRLGEVAVETRAQRARAVLGARQRGERQRWDMAAALRFAAADPLNQGVAVLLGHRDV